jgi:glucose-1-phosphate adenylyltransferase
MEEGSHSPAPRPRVGGALALILAGGSGSRLKGLTRYRAKPAVPFGGHYRTVDFTLSNCINSGIRRVALLTQYKSQSLIRHIQQGWGFLRRELNEFIEIWPAQQRHGERWYAGTVDAVYQNRDLIEALDPDYVLVLAGDHVYSMDYSTMLERHVATRADITVGCVEVPLDEARSFGIVGADRDGRMRSFVEKPDRPLPSPGRRNVTLASMGIYVFTRSALFDRLERDAADPDSQHDFGYSVLPTAIASARVFAYVFEDDRSGLPGYWRDVGTVDSYWRAHMELLDDEPKLDLFDSSWPIHTAQPSGAPARISRSVRVSASILGQGSIVAGDIHRSVLSANCRVGAHSRVEDSVLLPNVRIGRNCSLERVVVDSDCVIPDNTVIGGDLFEASGPYRQDLSPQGIVLVTRHAHDSTSAASAKRKVA